MKPLRATQLPKLRDEILVEFGRIVAYYTAALATTLDTSIGDLAPDIRQELSNLASTTLSANALTVGLSAAEMWWVSCDMTALAIDTATAQGELPKLPHLEPGDAGGLIHFDGGVSVGIDTARLEFDTLTWGPYLDHDTGIGLWRRTQNGVRGVGWERDDIDDHAAAELVSRLAIATTLLANEPTVAEARPATFARDGDPRDRRDRPVPGVTVIDLRPRPNPTTGPSGERLTCDREYTHRWIVRGHMHTYRHGKGRALTKKRWVAPYVAGPEDKPLVVKEHVWALRGTNAADRAA